MSVNRGTGAGGAGTNASGLPFEEKTANYKRLEGAGYETIYKNGSGTSRIMVKDTVTLMMKKGLGKHMKEKFNVNISREPDESYLVRNSAGYVLKILEKKNQNGSGSVEDKLLAAPGFLDEYAYYLKDVGVPIKVEYAFCLSNYFKSDAPKWQAFRHHAKKYGIPVFYGEDEDYFQKLDEWIKS